MDAVQTISPCPDRVASWAYAATDSRRDQRIDFLRGLALVAMVVAHVEVFSAFNLLTSERFGLVSGAEGFVMLSGFVVGQVYRPRLNEEGWVTTIYRLSARAWKLYVVNLVIILSFFFFSFIPFLDVSEVTHFTDRASGTVYPLYPFPLRSLEQALNSLFYLQAGPHQSQVLALYVVFLLFTPLAFAAFWKRQTALLLGASWLLYLLYQVSHFHPLGNNAERAFPLLAWQLLFFHGLAAGWFRNEIASYMHGAMKRWVVASCVLISTLLFFLAQNHTNPFLPGWAHMRLISADTFNALYSGYALKVDLGPLRVLNDFSLMISLYYLLTVCWRPLNRLFGWYLVPIGQASLYVFIIHVYIVFLVSQLITFDLASARWLLATLAHAGVLGLLWWMVRHKVGMRFIPV